MYIKVKVWTVSDSFNTVPNCFDVGIDNEDQMVYLTLDDERKLKVKQEDLNKIVKLFEV